MSVQFQTAFHYPDGTPLNEITVVRVESDDAHDGIVRATLELGAPALITLVRDGLAAGWLRIVE